MKLQFIRDGSPSKGPCWRGKRDGEEIVCIRVICGISLPQGLEAPKGCAILLAERYDEKKLPTFEVLGARVVDWRGLERALVTFRKVAQMGAVVAEDEQAVELIRRLRGVREAAPRVPCPIFPTPPEGLGEVGRQQTNELLHTGRLHLGPGEATLHGDPEPAARALVAAVSWLLRHRAHYRSEERDDLKAAGKRRARSAFGRPPGPDEPIPVPSLLSPRPGGQILVPTGEGKMYHFGRVGAGPVHPKVREANRRRARSWMVRFRD